LPTLQLRCRHVLRQRRHRPAHGAVAHLREGAHETLSTIYTLADKLEQVGIVEKKKTLNKLGRGQAFFFSIKQNAKAERVVNAIVKSITDRAAGGRKGK